MQRAFGKSFILMGALFFVCVIFLQSILFPAIVAGACRKHYTIYNPGATPAAPPPVAAAPAYGTCASVFPNATGAMPSVGDANVQLQNMAQVSCGPQPSLSYWVATVNNDCNTPACFTSAGVACTPGTDGCPCTVVTACTPRVFTAPLDCLLCPPMPCVVCPAPPAPAVNATANVTTANVTIIAPPPAAPAAVAGAPTAAPANATGRRSLLIFGGGSSGGGGGGGGSRGGGGGGGYSSPNNYNGGGGGGGGGGAAAAPTPSYECASAACSQCQAKYSWLHTTGGLICFAFLLFAGYNRSRLHSEYGIHKGGPCFEDSYLPWLFCWPCALCQEARTIDDMERDQELVHGMHNPQQQPLVPKMA